MIMEKFLYPNHPVRCFITGPSECGKSVFISNSISNSNNEYDKIYIHSPSLPQDLYQKLIKCSSNYMLIKLIPKIEEIVNNKDFAKSDTEIET